jgi:hypothetical protein
MLLFIGNRDFSMIEKTSSKHSQKIINHNPVHPQILAILIQTK